MQWNVTGAHRDTGAEMTLVVEAGSARSAEAEAERRGIIVPYAEPVTPSHAQRIEGRATAINVWTAVTSLLMILGTVSCSIGWNSPPTDWFAMAIGMAGTATFLVGALGFAIARVTRWWYQS